MKNNKGFTLVELLAVVAILSILAIISIPSIIELFNESKMNSFLIECKKIYGLAQDQWIDDSMLDTREQIYSRCDTCTGKTLQLSGRKEIDYYVKISKDGKVTEFYATDRTYQYNYNGGNLLVTDINKAEQISKLDEDQVLRISSSGATLNNSTNCEYKLITDRGSFSNTSDVKEVCFTIIDDGYVYSDNNTGWYHSVKDTRYKYLSLLVNPNQLNSSNDWIRVYNNSSKEKLLGEINYNNKPLNRISLTNNINLLYGIGDIAILLGEYDKTSVYVEKSSGLLYSLMYTYRNDYTRSYYGPWVNDSNFESAIDNIKNSLQDLGYSYIEFRSCESYDSNNETIFGNPNAPIEYNYSNCNNNSYYISYYNPSNYTLIK